MEDKNFEHYFSKNPKSKFVLKKIKANALGIDIELYSASGLFSKDKLDFASKLLIESVPLANKRLKVLDLGCGYGAIGIFLKLKYPEIEIYFSDVNPRACEVTKKNLKLHSLSGEVILSDSFENMEEMCFDIILLNPPMAAGKKVYLKLIRDALNHLRPRGQLYVVARHNKGGKSIVNFVKELGFCVETIKRKAGFHVYKFFKC